MAEAFLLAYPLPGSIVFRPAPDGGGVINCESTPVVVLENQEAPRFTTTTVIDFEAPMSRTFSAIEHCVRVLQERRRR
jgi:hypothetical protein